MVSRILPGPMIGEIHRPIKYCIDDESVNDICMEDFHESIPESLTKFYDKNCELNICIIILDGTHGTQIVLSVGFLLLVMASWGPTTINILP